MTPNPHREAGAQFTPGPWARGKDPYDLVIQSEHWNIATVDGMGNPWRGSERWNEREANAHLIAAAPELYEALRQCRTELDYCQQQLAAHGQTGHPEDSVSRALREGKAALAKARGEAA
jgi:hypothetical protein